MGAFTVLHHPESLQTVVLGGPSLVLCSQWSLKLRPLTALALRLVAYSSCRHEHKSALNGEDAAFVDPFASSALILITPFPFASPEPYSAPSLAEPSYTSVDRD